MKRTPQKAALSRIWWNHFYLLPALQKISARQEVDLSTATRRRETPCTAALTAKEYEIPSGAVRQEKEYQLHGGAVRRGKRQKQTFHFGRHQRIIYNFLKLSILSGFSEEAHSFSFSQGKSAHCPQWDCSLLWLHRYNSHSPQKTFPCMFLHPLHPCSAWNLQTSQSIPHAL